MNESLLKECTYIQARTAAALITMEGMKAENQNRLNNGHNIAYTEETFFKLIDEHGLNHNQLIMAFQNCY